MSVWPVAFAAKLYYEGPMCVQGQKVTAWHAGYGKEREFPIDMAGFAVNLELILKYSGAEFTRSKSGWLETNFLLQLGVTIQDLECRDGGLKEVGFVQQCSQPIPSVSFQSNPCTCTSKHERIEPASLAREYVTT